MNFSPEKKVTLTGKKIIVYSLYKQEIKMKTKIQKWGNSLGIRIPRVIAGKVGIKENSPVELLLKDHTIIIYPVKSKQTLKELVSEITKENLHTEVDTGLSEGGEIW